MTNTKLASKLDHWHFLKCWFSDCFDRWQLKWAQRLYLIFILLLTIERKNKMKLLLWDKKTYNSKKLIHARTKDLDIVKPWKKHTICQLGVTWRTPGSLVSPHLQWRTLSIIHHLGEGWLQLIQPVTLIGHHHVPHSVLNTFPDQFPFLFTCMSSPAFSLNPPNPTSSPKSLSNGLKCCSPLNSNQERCNLYHIWTLTNQHPPRH